MPKRALPPLGEVKDVVNRMVRTERRVTLLEQPDGAQTGNRLKRLEELFAAMPDMTLSITTGTLTASGNITAGGRVTGHGGVSSLPVYSNLLTTSYRAVYVTNTGGSGDFGYAPSSRRFKQDIADAPDTRASALAMQVVTFRYSQAVELQGDAAEVHWGVIAEDLHDLGLFHLVDYDDEGLPVGVKKEQMIFEWIPVIQDHERRLRAAGL